MKNLPGFSAEASLHKGICFFAIGSLNESGMTPADSRITPQQVSFPVYGNWCGPGHSGPGEPIDAVDAVCRDHDRCYDRTNYSNCGCDRALITRMPIAITRGWAGFPPPSIGGRAAGTAIAAFFSQIPCVCMKRVCGIPCGVKMCSKTVSYPCGVKWCKKWGVKYPCGVRYCSKTVQYPCGVKTCCKSVPVPGKGGIGIC
ncbi:MAG: hypothetical protein JSW64_08135 [Candidatus Zixiibacteriota bacterium]|nr:MAG: hypothetical protein JSW64_08135 [candidate division Zixibacteria bacterium]